MTGASGPKYRALSSSSMRSLASPCAVPTMRRRSFRYKSPFSHRWSLIFSSSSRRFSVASSMPNALRTARRACLLSWGCIRLRSAWTLSMPSKRSRSSD
ncbi:MAG: hypothetical protein MZV64_31810 [Ignavibacteriales bacterium]|nr:hypothetical protein [Ignavibacteriales bacterium]